MKKLSVFMMSALALVMAQAATIDQIIVRQQWPWSTDVKVEFKLSGVSDVPVVVNVRVWNEDTEISQSVLEKAIKGLQYGFYVNTVSSFTIDPVIALGVTKIKTESFKVELTPVETPSSFVDEALYRIYDLKEQTITDVTRAKLLNGEFGTFERCYTDIDSTFETSLPADEQLIWTGVTNDASYLTTKLVMRKVKTGRTWKVGAKLDDDPSTTEGAYLSYYAKLTNDYYIGVFPLTYDQSWFIRNSFNYSKFVKQDFGDRSGTPVDTQTDAFHLMHGTCTPANRDGYGYETNEKILWPTNSYLHDVPYASTLGYLRDRFLWKVHFDIPTNAQLDYAHRAGAAGDLCSGKPVTQANMEEMGWILSNSEVDGTNAYHRVGLKKPNALGLYDVHGNVMEAVVDQYRSEDQTDKGKEESNPRIEPIGGAVSQTGWSNGGSAYNSYKYCGIGRDVSFTWWQANPDSHIGWRLVAPATESGRWDR